MPHPIDRFLPPLLLQSGPREVLWWQWIALPLVGLAAFLVGDLLGRVTTGVAARVARRTSPRWDPRLLLRLRSPAILAWTAIAAQFLIDYLRLRPNAEHFFDEVIRVALFVAFFWALLRGIDVGSTIANESAWARTYPQSRSLVPLGSRVGKIAIFALAVVAVLGEVGYHVASLIAGLGIGGLAVALAAQKTLENLFGAFTIGVDQPFREGDYVKFGDVTGTVELVGLRSTRLRTLDRTIVTVPNGKLAEMQIETYAPRDRFKLSHQLRLDHTTTAAQVREVIAGVDRALRSEPKLFGDPVVRLTAIGELSLVIDVFAYLATTSDDEFQGIREQLLLAFLHVLEQAGARIAYPRRIVEQAAEKAPARP